MLGVYLWEAARKPWKWGEHDCCAFVAAWVRLNGHADPMAFIRGSYDSERSALRRIAEGGGLVPLWARGMADAGLKECADLRAGDAGIIPTIESDGTREVAAIFTGERWAALAHRGLVCEPATPLRAWRV